MIWIIASIPFWIMGAGAFIVAIVGIGKTARDAGGISDDGMKRALISIICLLVTAGCFFLLAAKICS